MSHPQPESKFKKKVVTAWRRGGPTSFVEKLHGSRYSRGLPDLLVAHANPKFFALIELKWEDGEVTPQQKRALRMYEEAGGAGIVLRGRASGECSAETHDGTVIFTSAKVPSLADLATFWPSMKAIEKNLEAARRALLRTSG